MEQVIKCPDCDVSMVKGFIPDRGYGELQQARWFPGNATFGTCLKFYWFEPKGTRLITSYCCPQCGLLRSYAHPRAN